MSQLFTLAFQLSLDNNEVVSQDSQFLVAFTLLHFLCRFSSRVIFLVNILLFSSSEIYFELPYFLSLLISFYFSAEMFFFILHFCRGLFHFFFSHRAIVLSQTLC